MHITLLPMTFWLNLRQEMLAICQQSQSLRFLLLQTEALIGTWTLEGLFNVTELLCFWLSFNSEDLYMFYPVTRCSPLLSPLIPLLLRLESLESFLNVSLLRCLEARGWLAEDALGSVSASSDVLTPHLASCFFPLCAFANSLAVHYREV